MKNHAKEVNAQEFYEETKSGVTVVDFFATWCGPCQAQLPIMDELAGSVEGDVSVIKADVDRNQDIASQFGIMSIPTIVFFKDGKEIKRLQGLQSQESLTKELQAIVA